MRHLLLLRHAKTERADGRREDRERALTGRGRREARLMGRLLTAAELVPEAVLTSPAERARTTAELAIEAGGWRCKPRVLPSLYASSVAVSLDALRTHGGPAETVLMVGHQPTWSAFASALTGADAVHLPTGAIVHVAFAVDSWGEVGAGTGELWALVSPSWVRGLTGEPASDDD